MKKIVIFFFVLSVIICANAFAREKTSQEIQEERARINKNPAVRVFNDMVQNAEFIMFDHQTDSKEVSIFYVLNNTVQSVNNFKQAWILKISFIPKTASITYSKQYNWYDPKEMKASLMSYVVYDKKGNAVQGHSYQSIEWRYIIPGSIGEAIYKEVVSPRNKKQGDFTLQYYVETFARRSLCGLEKNANLNKLFFND